MFVLTLIFFPSYVCISRAPCLANRGAILKNNYIKDKDLSLFINDLNVKFKDIENTIENNNNILNNKSVTYDENFNDIRNIFIEADRRIISINQSLSTTTQDVNYLGDKVDNLTEVVKKITSTLI